MHINNALKQQKTPANNVTPKIHGKKCVQHTTKPVSCSARSLALACLLQAHSTLPFPVILEQAYQNLANTPHIQQEKNFLMALCYGVLRHHGLTKQLFLPLCRQKLDAEMEYCLSLCLYEVLFLHKETHNAVNEYVNIIKERQGQPKANALNAILRNLLDNGKNQKKIQAQLDGFTQIIQTPIPTNQIPPRKKLRTLHALADLSEIFTDETDKNFIQIITEESFYTPLPSFRINKTQLKKASAHLSLNSKQYSFNALKITDLLFADEYSSKYSAMEKQGLLTRQGICSALLTEKVTAILKHNLTKHKNIEHCHINHNQTHTKHCEQASSLTVAHSSNTDLSSPTMQATLYTPLWDMCCGRGGKTLGLIEKGITVSLATDPNKTRLTELCNQLHRLHLLADTESCTVNNQTNKTTNIPTNEINNTGREVKKQIDNIIASTDKTLFITSTNGVHPLEVRTGLAENAIQNATLQSFPYILLDSPCSTSGTIARNPEVRYRITQESLAEILSTQKKLLRLAYQHLQVQGYLFYCTCSIFTKENKGQIKQFLTDFPNMCLISEEYLHATKYSPRLKGHDILYFAVLKKE